MQSNDALPNISFPSLLMESGNKAKSQLQKCIMAENKIHLWGLVLV